MAHLVKLAKEFDGELGLQIQYASSGGASDTNTTSAMGIPTLDGLGAGAGWHIIPGVYRAGLFTGEGVVGGWIGKAH